MARLQKFVQHRIDVTVDEDGTVGDLAHRHYLAEVHAGVRGAWVVVGVAPEGVLDDGGGVMFIAHHV
jgi:FtsP/CotA-like multicopper oxidase with cupredoxin domain